MDKQQLRKWAVEQVLEHMLYDSVAGGTDLEKVAVIISIADSLADFVDEGI